MKRSGFKAKSLADSALVTKKVKPRKCKICHASYTPRSAWQKVCGNVECAIAWSALERKKIELAAAKKDRKETTEKKLALKGLSYWEGRTERACNALVRARDPDVCISCGTTQSPAFHAGHYKSVGSNSTLRFNLFNINKQCVQCNLHKGGNATNYRIGLIKKIGLEEVEKLEVWHPPQKMTIEYCQQLESEFKQQLKEIKNGLPNTR